MKELGYSRRVGLDCSEEAIRWCAEKGLGEVRRGDIRDLPFGEDEFSLVLATDILEHVEDDVKALAEIHRVLAPGGVAIITVPAFESLWGLQDDVAHHKRRYLKRDLLQRIRQGGLACQDCYYFNYLLFAPIWAARRLIKLLGIELQSENQVNTPVLNRVLTWIFTLDVATARFVRPPFGVSIVAVTRRAAGHSRS